MEHYQLGEHSLYSYTTELSFIETVNQYLTDFSRTLFRSYRNMVQQVGYTLKQKKHIYSVKHIDKPLIYTVVYNAITSVYTLTLLENDNNSNRNKVSQSKSIMTGPFLTQILPLALGNLETGNVERIKKNLELKLSNSETSDVVEKCLSVFVALISHIDREILKTEEPSDVKPN